MVKSLKLIIEALLFATDKPLNEKDIHEILPDSEIKNIKSALRSLKYEYEAMERSFQLVEVAGGYQFRSRAIYGPYILKMYQKTPSKLSKAGLETLAIIAYKQPITKQEIERIRGVDSSGIIKTLLEKDLIRITGRKKVPGRPILYGTSKRFLEVFNLKDIDDLPRLKEIKALLGDETPQQKDSEKDEKEAQQLLSFEEKQQSTNEA